MSLLFSLASTDTVQHGSGASIDDLPSGTNGFSILMWVYRTSDTNVQGLWGHRGSAGSRLAIRNVGGEGAIEFRFLRATTPARYIGAAGNVPKDAWTFVAATYQDSLSTEMDIYTGSLTSRVIETSYDTVENGAGSYTSDAGVNKQFGAVGTGSNALGGRIAVAMLFDKRLTLAEIISQQFRPHNTTNCVLFSHYGFNGTGTQPDWSGSGNSGTVTGATVAPHVPINVRQVRTVTYVPYKSGVAHTGVSSGRTWTRQTSIAAVTVAAVSGLFGGASTSALANVEANGTVSTEATTAASGLAANDISAISATNGVAEVSSVASVDASALTIGVAGARSSAVGETVAALIGLGDLAGRAFVDVSADLAAEGEATLRVGSQTSVTTDSDSPSALQTDSRVSAVASVNISAVASAVGAARSEATASLDISALGVIAGRGAFASIGAIATEARLTWARFRFPKAEYSAIASIRNRAIATIAPDGLDRFSAGDVKGEGASDVVAALDVSAIQSSIGAAISSALATVEHSAISSVDGKVELRGEAALEASAFGEAVGKTSLSVKTQALGLLDGFVEVDAGARTSIASITDYIAASANRTETQTSAATTLDALALTSIAGGASVSASTVVEIGGVNKLAGKAQTSAFVTGDWVIPASVNAGASTSAVATVDMLATASVKADTVAAIISGRTVRVGGRPVGKAITSVVTQSLGPLDAIGQVTGRGVVSSAIGTTGLATEGVVQIIARAVTSPNPYILVSATGAISTEALTGVVIGPSFPTEARGPFGAFAIRIDAKSVSATFCDDDTVAAHICDTRTVRADFGG